MKINFYKCIINIIIAYLLVWVMIEPVLTEHFIETCCEQIAEVHEMKVVNKEYRRTLVNGVRRSSHYICVDAPEKEDVWVSVNSSDYKNIEKGNIVTIKETHFVEKDSGKLYGTPKYELVSDE